MPRREPAIGSPATSDEDSDELGGEKRLKISEDLCDEDSFEDKEQDGQPENVKVIEGQSSTGSTNEIFTDTSGWISSSVEGVFVNRNQIPCMTFVTSPETGQLILKEVTQGELPNTVSLEELQELQRQNQSLGEEIKESQNEYDNITLAEATKEKPDTPNADLNPKKIVIVSSSAEDIGQTTSNSLTKIIAEGLSAAKVTSGTSGGQKFIILPHNQNITSNQAVVISSQGQTMSLDQSERRNLSLEALFKVTDNELQNISSKKPPPQKLLIDNSQRVIAKISSMETRPANKSAHPGSFVTGHLLSNRLGGEASKADKPLKKLGKYICSFCGRACAKPSVLQKHLRAHTGERPYPCLDCGFHFKTKSNLYKHCKSRTHKLKVGLLSKGDKQEDETDANIDGGNSEPESDPESEEGEKGFKDDQGISDKSEILDEKGKQDEESVDDSMIQFVPESQLQISEYLSNYDMVLVDNMKNKEPEKKEQAQKHVLKEVAKYIRKPKEERPKIVTQTLPRPKLVSQTSLPHGRILSVSETKFDPSSSVQDRLKAKLERSTSLIETTRIPTLKRSLSVANERKPLETSTTTQFLKIAPKQQKNTSQDTSIRSQLIQQEAKARETRDIQEKLFKSKGLMNRSSSSLNMQPVIGQPKVEIRNLGNTDTVLVQPNSSKFLENEATQQSLLQPDLDKLTESFQQASKAGTKLSAALTTLPDGSCQVVIHYHPQQTTPEPEVPIMQQTVSMPSMIPKEQKANTNSINERIQNLIKANYAIVNAPMADAPRQRRLSRQNSDAPLQLKSEPNAPKQEFSNLKVEIPKLSTPMAKGETKILQTPSQDFSLQALMQTSGLQTSCQTFGLQSSGQSLGLQASDQTSSLETPNQILGLQSLSRTLALHSPSQTMGLQSSGQSSGLQTSGQTLGGNLMRRLSLENLQGNLQNTVILPNFSALNQMTSESVTKSSVSPNVDVVESQQKPLFYILKSDVKKTESNMTKTQNVPVLTKQTSSQKVPVKSTQSNFFPPNLSKSQDLTSKTENRQKQFQEMNWKSHDFISKTGNKQEANKVSVSASDPNVVSAVTTKDLEGHDITIKIKLNQPEQAVEITKNKRSSSSQTTEPYKARKVGETNFCEKCKGVFKNKQDLEIHQRRKCKMQNPLSSGLITGSKFQCVICGVQFRNSRELMIHQKVQCKSCKMVVNGEVVQMIINKNHENKDSIENSSKIKDQVLGKNEHAISKKAKLQTISKQKTIEEDDEELYGSPKLAFSTDKAIDTDLIEQQHVEDGGGIPYTPVLSGGKANMVKQLSVVIPTKSDNLGKVVDLTGETAKMNWKNTLKEKILKKRSISQDVVVMETQALHDNEYSDETRKDLNEESHPRAEVFNVPVVMEQAVYRSPQIESRKAGSESTGANDVQKSPKMSKLKAALVASEPLKDSIWTKPPLLRQRSFSESDAHRMEWKEKFPRSLFGHSFPSLRAATYASYCCLQRPQPMYVAQSKKISMYSNWRNAPHDPNPEGLTSKMLLSLYDSSYTSNPVYNDAHQDSQKGGLLTHSSYWTFKQNLKPSTAEPKQVLKRQRSESVTKSEEEDAPAAKEIKVEVSQVEGGYKSMDNYTYVRGRGRGKYVCSKCGIRCKKPSMLKKHIRTHTEIRPYKCKTCPFRFKTKGNLTKHMKSKAHHKLCTEKGIIPVPTEIDETYIDQEALKLQCEISQKAKIQTKGELERDESMELDEDENEEDDGLQIDEEIDEQGDDEQMIEYDDDDGKEMYILRITESPIAESSMVEEIEASKLVQENEPSLSTLPRPSSETGLVSSRPAMCPKVVSDHVTCVSITMADSSTETEAKSKMSSSLGTVYGFNLSSQGGSGEKTEVQSEIAKSLLALAEQKSSSQAGTSKEKVDQPTYWIGEPMVALPPTVGQVHEVESFEVEDECSESQENLPEEQSETGGATPEHTESSKTKETATRPNELFVTVPLGGFLPPMRHSPGQLKRFKPATELSNLLKLTEESLNDTKQDLSMASPAFQFSHPFFSISKEGVLTLANSLEKSSPDSSVVIIEDDVGCVEATVENVVFVKSDDELQTIEDVSGVKSKEEILQEKAITQNLVASSKGGKFICEICLKKFQEHQQLILHRKTHFLDMSYKCQKCKLRFNSQDMLKVHEQTEAHISNISQNLIVIPTSTNPRPFKCEDCDIAFRVKGHLAKHLRSRAHVQKWEHLGKIPHGTFQKLEHILGTLEASNTSDFLVLLLDLMKQKNKEAESEYTLSYTKTSTGARKPMCYTEQRKLSSTPGVPANVEVKPYPIESSVTDSVKGESSKGEEDEESDNGPHLCGICRRGFINLEHLKSHLIIHADLRPYVCEYCDAGFTNVQSLKTHLQSHAQETPYVCGFCGLTFACSDSLKHHLDTHSKQTIVSKETEAANQNKTSEAASQQQTTVSIATETGSQQETSDSMETSSKQTIPVSMETDHSDSIFEKEQNIDDSNSDESCSSSLDLGDNKHSDDMDEVVCSSELEVENQTRKVTVVPIETVEFDDDLTDN